MAHYALLDENNIVVDVFVGKDENEPDNNGNILDWELHYSEVTSMTCKRTSYNTYGNKHLSGGTPFRGNYAGKGYTYDKDFDVFIPPRPYPSWKLNYETFVWVAPVLRPDDGPDYTWRWSEINQEWIKLTD